MVVKFSFLAFSVKTSEIHNATAHFDFVNKKNEFKGAHHFSCQFCNVEKKEQADCVHMISNKHVKGFNIVISSGKMVLSPVFHLVILTR